ncbi:13947_t:CDS:2 [Entrophospora sp. SA101]|nr:13947_t:CDS:2 [Entrophospora sp. SA101]
MASSSNIPNTISLVKKGKNALGPTPKSSYKQPLPISLSTSTTATNTNIIGSIFTNFFKTIIRQFDPIINAVIVKKNTKEDINKLWNQGFFGKGNLSRSEPTWDWRKRLERKVRGNAGDCNNIGGGSGSKEYLHLTTEEAFFLCFGIESLNVYDKNEYVAYHYFRSLGWVVRCGMKFGVDYVLYEKGPPFKHSQ